jgi:hypothetical protein
MKRFCLSLVLALVAYLLHPTFAYAQSRSYCAVEVGSKGVKGRAFQFGAKGADSGVVIAYTRDINTTIIAGMKDGEFSPSGIAETADAVATLVKEMRAAASGCRPFAVGSSGLSGAKNRDQLVEAIGQRVELPPMEFISAEQEAEFGFISSVPKKEWPVAVLVDIGSANTKLGYRGESGFRAAEIPLGSVTLTKLAAGGGADFGKALAAALDSSVRPAVRELASRLPGIMNKKKVFWIGGAAWSTATFMRPDQGTRDFVRLDRTDVKRFLGALNDRSWANHKPSAKASSKARAVYEKDSARVVEVFSRDNLLSGVGIFDAFLNDRGVDGPLYFARSGNWIMGYAAMKFADDVWGEDALPVD